MLRCITAPLTDYVNNEVYQELVRQEKYLTTSGKKLYIDLRRSKDYLVELEKLTGDDSGLTLTVALKNTATKKMRLRVTGYSLGEYLRFKGVIKTMASQRIKYCCLSLSHLGMKKKKIKTI